MQENFKLVPQSSVQRDDQQIDRNLLALVVRLQKEEKTFNDTHYATEEDVISLLNGILERVIRSPISDIYQIDTALGVLLCHAFFGRNKYLKEIDIGSSLNTDMWSCCRDPLYALLLAAYVSDCAAKFYESIKRDPEEFRECHRYFEEEAFNLLDEIYKDNDAKLEFHVLAKDYERRFRRKIPMKPGIKELPLRMSMPKQRQETSVELLAVAFRGNCMKFVSHVACQEYIGLRWESGKVADSFAQALQLPSDDISLESFQSCSLRSVTTIRMDDVRVLGFGNEALGFSQMESWCSPQRKFILYTIFLVTYLVVYARVMITKPLLLIERGQFDYFELTLLGYVWLTQIVQQFPVVYATVKQRGRLYWWEDYQMSTWRMCIVFLNLVFIFLSIAPVYNFRSLAFAVSEILFMITFVLSTVASLRYLSIFTFFGSKMELLLQTARSIVKYMTLFLIFWVIYAVCYLSLTESLSSSNDSILWQVLQSGAFEILGESKDEDRVGNLTQCSPDVYWIDVLSLKVMGMEDVRCFFRGTLIPPLLFFYMMTAAVMLVNIFTAMLSHEYERTVEYADRYSKFHKYGMLASFESKVILPRPLNLFYFILRYFFEKCLCRVVCRCCSRSSHCPWLSYLEGRPWGSSPPGAIVNETAVTDIINKALKKREPNAFAAEVQKYTAGLPTGYGSNVNDAEMILNNILKLYKDFMKGQTQQTRERVATMLDMANEDVLPIGDRASPGISMR